MKKFWIAVLIALAPDGFSADVKTLSFNFNDNVTIFISNIPCPDPKLNKQYKYVAQAVKYADKNRQNPVDAMNACWANKGDDIEIQWVGGDKSVFPANLFLVKGNV